MSRNVIILGAGASSEAGVPTMWQFVDRAEALMADARTLNERSAFELVFEALDQLRHSSRKARVNTNNVEDVFSAFEMAGYTSRLGAMSPQHIRALPTAMKTVITRTVELSMQFDGLSSEAPLRPAAVYNNLAKFISEDFKGDTAALSIISFNYDIGLDHALNYWGLPIQYHLDDFKEKKDGISVLKLHGSLNFATCNSCPRLYSAPIDSRRFFSESVYNNIEVLPLVQRLSCEGCGTFLTEQLLAPPTPNKAQYYGRLKNVWAQASQSLSDAENIFVVGYSLPSTDAFFRDLYATGTIGKTRLKRFWVVNPDKDVEPKFRRLLGQEAEERFRFLQRNFSASVDEIRGAWKMQNAAAAE